MASSDVDVQMYLAQLRTKLPYVPPVPVKKIRALHRKGDLGGDPPPGPTFDFARFEQDLRRNVCSSKGANIKRGVAYYYEYRRLSGQWIVGFKIDDCP